MRAVRMGAGIDYAGTILHNSVPAGVARTRCVALPRAAGMMKLNEVAWRAN